MMSELESKISALLLQEWDPIGVHDESAARDEYDRYVPQVAGMIRSKKSPHELAAYLLSIETKKMGLSGNAHRARMVAAHLVELR